MGRVKARSLRLREAAEMLDLSYRQTKRVWARYRDQGAKALQHGNCGRVSNRAYTAKFRAAGLQQVQARYEDFGPTLGAEYLASDDGMAVHAETLRRWLKEAGLWQRQRRRKPYRQRRETKAHFGELVQLDGSFHEWLEERGPRGHQDRLVKKLRLAGIRNYDQANAYLEKRYLAEHNRHYGHAAAAESDYHRRRPTAR